MRIVLVGTRTFGRTALEAVLAAGHDVALVSSPLGDPVMYGATRLGLPWVPVLDAAAVLAADADVALSAHSHQFLGQRTRAATRLGALVYHPSLLPRHRGKDAVRWTVHLKDPTAATSVDQFRGRQVWIDHGAGVVTRYCHLSGIAPGMATDMDVTAGQLIAFVGESGTPSSTRQIGTQYHLHFEVRVGDSYLGHGLPAKEVRPLYEELFGAAGK